MQLKRREFLLALPALWMPGRFHGAQCRWTPNQPRGTFFQQPNAVAAPVPLNAPPGGYVAEAERLTTLIYHVYWDSRVKMFRAPVRDADSLENTPPRTNGCFLWPSLVALHVLVEGEKVFPGRYKARIAEVIDGLEQYYNANRHAYTAWLYFPGNDDMLYDDNAWIVNTLMAAHQVTGEPAYRERAIQVMTHFVLGGWDATGKPGGVRWGTRPNDRRAADKTVSATAGAAYAALLLAHAGVDKDRHIAWAREALAWIGHLQDTDDLIRDGLRAPDWAIMPTKWTYNTGVTLRAHIELYRLTQEPASLEEAKRLGHAAIDRGKALYDGAVRDPEKRFWYDGGYFVHYLADGLLALYAQTHEKALLDEIRRNAAYGYTYLRDPADGLYFRGWRLWRIGTAQQQVWRRLTGQEPPTDLDPDERSQEKQFEHTPISERPLVKTLLANAGTARLFWLLAQAENGKTI